MRIRIGKTGLFLEKKSLKVIHAARPDEASMMAAEDRPLLLYL